MSLDEYRLSCHLLGHSLDVRAVAEGPTNSIISGSRDKTAKVWNSEGSTYVEGITLRDHKNFICAVCVLGNGEWICTSSNDATICIYISGNVVPFTVLKGHTSTVCALAPGLDPNTLVSGSWDKTARIWTLNSFDAQGLSPSITLAGHEAAVWAVTTLSSGQYVTGSADKLIFFWNKKGEKIKVLKGHTDCVRALVGLDDGFLISCGNDAIIKYWNGEGDCIKELHGHSNYIYTMALNKAVGPDIVVSGGEDSTIRMWNSQGPLGEAITLPAQSVWSVACLRNGDIVTGTSDGIVTVFTKDPSRFANSQIQDAHCLAVENHKLSKKSELGGIKVNELPGPEILLDNGTAEGQTKIVREANGKILCYQWTNGEWVCLGDVTGASGGSQQSSGKVLHNGAEFDYVFNVDISESHPPLKLPYNRGEDPWIIAQKFIHENELPQAYLEQVANFIITNSNNTTVTAQPTNVGYQDPFTGGARYIPGSNSSVIAPRGGDFVDPFTGASSYRTNQSQQQQQPNNYNFEQNNTKSSISAAGDKHFPFSNYMSFDACDPSKVLVKLKEFNSKITDQTLKVTDSDLENVIKLADPAPTGDDTSIGILKILLNWPKELLFPVLDVARLAVRHHEICSKLATPEFMQSSIIDGVGHTTAANQLMAARTVANLMINGWGRGILEGRVIDIVQRLVKIKQGSLNLQIAVATVYLNFTISQLKMADQVLCRILTEGLLEFLKWATDLEAHYRAYQALGNLTCTPFGQITSTQIISVDEIVTKISSTMSAQQPIGFEKLNELARDLTTAL